MSSIDNAELFIFRWNILDPDFCIVAKASSTRVSGVEKIANSFAGSNSSAFTIEQMVLPGGGGYPQAVRSGQAYLRGPIEAYLRHSKSGISLAATALKDFLHKWRA
ncbi:hypothetical protein [Rhizobium rhizogenes]|uniref:hypothetical protein n=1 Tax=Rhizobium rhizogenes TaxID=359 RepID=UPI001573557C|nr:hypothetical protein [Rhizobium rhizogenes]NTF45302.1 hypothetical protein [Rhizobium rhizogenes]